MLWDAGANTVKYLAARDQEGATPLDLALRQGHLHIAVLLA
jgi:ankyrin repeat protein